MAMLNKPPEEEETEQEEKVVEEQPEIIADDLIKTPGERRSGAPLLEWPTGYV